MPIRSSRTFMEVTITGFLRKKRAPDILRAIERGLIAGAVEAIPVVKAFTPKDQHLLENSYGVNFRKNPRRAVIVSSSDPGKVGAMEDGRRAAGGPLQRDSYSGIGMPPPGPIRAWVTRKLGVPSNKVNSVAFLVARKIAIRGIQVPLPQSGLGAMFRRAARTLGARFFSNRIAREIDLLR